MKWRKKGKYTLWYVDDLKENRDNFEKNHKEYFNIELFEKPSDISVKLENNQQPDALLCDIYFIEDDQKREEIENKIDGKKKELSRIYMKYRLDKDESGIQLIENIRRKYGEDLPYPIYAYTSKAPYIMEGSGFERLGKLDIKWLFKKRTNVETERLILQKDVNQFKKNNKPIRKFMRKHPFLFWLGSVVLGGIIYKGLEILINLLVLGS